MLDHLDHEEEALLLALHTIRDFVAVDKTARLLALESVILNRKEALQARVRHPSCEEDVVEESRILNLYDVVLETLKDHFC